LACPGGFAARRARAAAPVLRPLCLHPRELLMEVLRGRLVMEAAFLVFRRLPPPAPRAIVLTRLDRSRARRASDRGVSLVVERRIRHVVRTDVIPDLILGPDGDRVQLENVDVR